MIILLSSPCCSDLNLKTAFALVPRTHCVVVLSQAPCSVCPMPHLFILHSYYHHAIFRLGNRGLGERESDLPEVTQLSKWQWGWEWGWAQRFNQSSLPFPQECDHCTVFPSFFFKETNWPCHWDAERQKSNSSPMKEISNERKHYGRVLVLPFNYLKDKSQIPYTPKFTNRVVADWVRIFVTQNW